MDAKLQDFFLRRQQAYLGVFKRDGEDLKLVMEDLTQFCRGESSSFHPDARVHAVLEGRREVYLRILEHINLSPEEFLKRKGKRDDDERTSNSY